MSEFTNRRGVNLVESASLQLGWFFRPQETSDQGIDAHVEKALGEVGTGRLLAIQIKSGRSYFSEPTDDGWLFRFDAKKAKLWLGHALPVLVVLVDVDGGVVYWQQISARTVVSTGKGFKVVVPRGQTVDEADPEWTHIASGLESRAVDRFDFAVTVLPPSVRQTLDRPDAERLDAAILALHLAEGRSNPRGTTESLLATSPGWIERGASWAWRAVASYAAEHDLTDLSAVAFERAAAATPGSRGQLLAAAALNIMESDRSRAAELLAQADAAGGAPILVAVVKTLLGHPEGDAEPRHMNPLLLSDSEAVRTSAVAQGLLSDQAARVGDIDAMCNHARLALQTDPTTSHAMVAVAEALIRRSVSSKRHVDDLPTAIDLIERALDQRHAWAGPTLPILFPLIRAYGLSGQYEKMLERCLPAPVGTATQDEADHPHIRRNALYAANFAGRTDILEQLAANVGDSAQDRIAKFRIGALQLEYEDQVALWAEELSRAVDDADYEASVTAVVALASLGHDERPRLVPLVERGIAPASYLDLVEALIAARSDLDAALPTLRSLARRDSVAAEYLIGKLTRADRRADAARECLALYEQNGNPDYLITRAQILLEGKQSGAEAAAREAVDATSGFPTERARLLTFLAAQAAGRDDWDAAEKRLTEVLTLRANPASEEVWRVVLAQVNQGRLRRAANTIAEYRPTVNTRDEAKLWLQANSVIPWDEAKASEALSLARRFNDPRLSTALLGHIVSGTRGVPEAPEAETASSDEPEIDADLEERRRIAQGAVPAELHQQAFAALQDLVDQFGDATGVTVLRGDPDQLIADMTSQMQEAATAAAHLKDLITAAHDARLPRGLLATIRGQSYATMLVQRTLGALVSGAADDNEHELDVHTAAEAIGQPVVVEPATLLVLTGLPSRVRLEGQFPTLLLPAQAMRDIHRATFDIRTLASSPGTTGWDQNRGSLIFWELSEAEFTRQLRRAQAMEDLAQDFTVRTTNNLDLFPDLGEDPKHASWLQPIQLAHDQGVALWSDDLGLRRLARGMGVACFGTPALIDALRDHALQTASSKEALDTILDRTAADNRDLALDLVVDVALHIDDLLWIAERDGWLPHAGGLVLSRASWWAWQTAPIQDLMALYQKIAFNNPDSLPDWQQAAMIGAARAFKPADTAIKVLAAVALLGFGNETSTDTAAAGIRRARRVAEELGLPDPVGQLPAAASTLVRYRHTPEDPEQIVSAILAHL
ncbi:DUF4365 domain-containing protein [Phytohabitans aurantiacus]|uniref:DUF4365 domain-containing protein n=1 Tax=Phytohabitans aurantiacus TaxID=3016789 RepID=A0ABQ5RBG3_9ACTN|nr:DUF4365 domain-containing protein [Phytohabitans aurantiacus]GLI02931.1 hypothetical protein Pa4123_82090 [Phytohabitans aurantiacus]